MARKREISFFTDIQSDEKLDEFLKQNVMLGKSKKSKNLSHIKNLQSKLLLLSLVLDVYQEMFGPCVSLQSTLEQYKVSNFQNLIVTTKIQGVRNLLHPHPLLIFPTKLITL